MKELKSQKNKEREYLSGEESFEYWDEHDTSELLETGERIRLEVVKPDYRCESCGSSRIRKRMIDLPILDDTVVLKRTKIFFCADCKTSVFEKEGFEELKDRLHRLTAEVDAKALYNLVAEGLASYEKKWVERENERKVISVYFSTREGIPTKAQISLLVSDPLYAKLRLVTSEDVRNMLGLQHFEDLESEAQKQNRSISQYLKLELAKRLLEDSLKPSVEKAGKTEQEARNRNAKVRTLHIVPRTVEPSYFRQEQLEPLALAAKSEEDEKIVLLESDDKEFVGVLQYDYASAGLFIEVVKDSIGLSVFDAELTMDDNTVEERKDLKVENKKVLLLPETPYTEDSVSEITLKMKQ
jgi:hypothetical protein